MACETSACTAFARGGAGGHEGTGHAALETPTESLVFRYSVKSAVGARKPLNRGAIITIEVGKGSDPARPLSTFLLFGNVSTLYHVDCGFHYEFWAESWVTPCQRKARKARPAT